MSPRRSWRGDRRVLHAEAAGKTVLVTGATDGVGRVVAERLGVGGARVLVHGRNRERGADVVDEIRRKGGAAEFFAADFSSLAEVCRLADAVRAQALRLDILVNNAGTTATAWQASADGHELTLAVNYLAGFLLTRRLLPLLMGSAPARVVNVVSAGQQEIDFDDMMLKQQFSGQRAYRQSKLAQILFTMDLARELEGSGVTVNALHPATFMNTTMVKRAGIAPISRVEDGADAIVHLAVAPALASHTGRYFNGMRDAHANRQAYDTVARQRLRDISLSLTAAWLP